MVVANASSIEISSQPRSPGLCVLGTLVAPPFFSQFSRSKGRPIKNEALFPSDFLTTTHQKP